MKSILVTTPPRFDRLMKQLSKYDVCGFDVEAVGPRRRYTQAKAQAFMNVPLSSLQGAAWGFEDGTAFYMPIRHRGPVAKYAWLDDAVDATGRMDAVWAHNVKFDSTIMRQEGYDVRKWRWRDSMLAAWAHFTQQSGIGLKELAVRLLNRQSPAWTGSLIDKTAAEVLDYVCHDALNTLEIGEMVVDAMQRECPRLAAYFQRVDSPLAEILGRVESVGLPVDVEKLSNTLGEATAKELTGLYARWHELAGDLNPHSQKDLQELFEEGTLKSLKRTPAGAHSTAGAVLKHNAKWGTESQKELAQCLLDVREASKAKSTYVDTFYEEVRQWPDRRLHSELLQTGTRTTRLASRNPNQQNQMAHGKWAHLLQEAYAAPWGESFASCDYGQQEPRIFAQLAGDGELQQIFRDGRDVYLETASTFSGTRQQGKTIVLGFMMYGGSHYKLASELVVSKKEAQDIIFALNKRFPEGPAFRDKVIRIAEGRKPWPYVRVKSGHRRWVPELTPGRWLKEDPEAYTKRCDVLSQKYGIDRGDTSRLMRTIRSSGERIALNTIIQGSGAAMTKEAMVLYDGQPIAREYPIVMMKHDEIMVMGPEYGVPRAAKGLENAMLEAAQAQGYTVPFVAEANWGKTWAECK